MKTSFVLSCRHACAVQAYDREVLRMRGPDAVTNFPASLYAPPSRAATAAAAATAARPALQQQQVLSSFGRPLGGGGAAARRLAGFAGGAAAPNGMHQDAGRLPLCALLQLSLTLSRPFLAAFHALPGRHLVAMKLRMHSCPSAQSALCFAQTGEAGDAGVVGESDAPAAAPPQPPAAQPNQAPELAMRASSNFGGLPAAASGSGLQHPQPQRLQAAAAHAAPAAVPCLVPGTHLTSVYKGVSWSGPEQNRWLAVAWDREARTPRPIGSFATEEEVGRPPLLRLLQ